MIRKTKQLTDDILDELNDHVFNTTGYEVQFIVKPMNEGFNVPEIVDNLKEILKVDETGDVNKTNNNNEEEINGENGISNNINEKQVMTVEKN